MFLSLTLPIKATTFEGYSNEVTYKIETALLAYLNIIKVKTVDDMATFFASLEIDSGTVCNKKLVEVGAWRCNDCVKNDNIIFCQDCWSQMKDKHQKHNVIFINRVNGTCDCGDHNCINKKYFCSKHKGIIERDDEMVNYVSKCLGPSYTSSFTLVNELLFDVMHTYIIKAIEEKKTTSKPFLKVMNEFTNCFGILCEMSSACNFIICELLLKKYSYKTKHTCLDINDKNCKMIKPSFFNHECTCPFIRFLLEFWPGKKTKLLYRLIRNYKLKKMIGLFFFLFYSEHFNNCIFDFEEISVQIIFSDVIEIACKIPGLIDNMYDGMFNILSNSFNDEMKFNFANLLTTTLSILSPIKRYSFLKDITLKFKYDTKYLAKPVAVPYLSNNANIICKLIDITALLHNVNPVKVVFPPPEEDLEAKFMPEILDIELDILDIFSFFASIFNFDDNSLVKEVFSYFSKVITKKAKKNLAEDEYSFHITLYRAFAVFLNRYCFHEANKTNTNVFKTLQNVTKLMPEFSKCSKEMIKSVYKVFGFITACQEGFFIYYGVHMSKYEYFYYFLRQIVYRDFCLLKYLLALKENAEFLGFNTILRLCQVENSHKPIEEYILKNDKVESPSLWLNDWNKQYLKFSSKILFIILSLLRNNTSLIWTLTSSYEMMKSNKVHDKLLDDILKKDINNFLELTKELVINQILIKENLAYFTDITDNIFPCLRDFFGEKNVTDIIISLTNKTLTKEKKAKFSLKDELLYYLDLNYIIYPMFKTKAEKYISDFKSKVVSIFNIHFYPVNKYESKLTEENYNQLYFNDKNFDFLFKFTSFILTQKGYEILNEYFLSVLLNYLSTFLCLDSDHFVFLRENLKTNYIVEVLEKNNLTDEVKKSYCKFIVQKFREQVVPLNDPMDMDFKNKNKNSIKEEKKDLNKNENNVQPVKKSSKISMKERMKNKFKKKNDNIIDKFGVDKIVVDDTKQGSESCIFCLKPIDLNDISKPFGVIGDFMCDNYTSNAFFQTIRKAYKKHYDTDLTLPEFEKLYYQPLERRSIRIISCNHYIHFTCFFEKFMESDLLLSLNIYSCPLCNRLNETCVPMLVQYTDEQTKGFFKPFDFNDVFNYGKQNIEEYENQLAADAKKKEKKEEESDEDSFSEEKAEESKKELDITKQSEDNQDKKEESIIEIKKGEEEKEKNNEIENFRKTYPDFVNLCKHFVEGFVGMKAGLASLDIEDKYMKPVIGKFSTAFSIQYRDFFCYLDNIEEKKYSIMLWKNFVLSMRLMMKLDIILKEKYFLRLYKMIKEFSICKFDNPIKDIIQFDNVKLKTCEILFLLSILFNFEQIDGYEKYILYMVLPIYAFGFFLREIYYKTSFYFLKEKFLVLLDSQKLYQYLKEDNATLNNIIVQVVKELVYNKVVMNTDIDVDKLSLELNDNLDFLNLSSLKGKTFLEIMEILHKSIEEDKDSELKFLYDNLKINNDYKQVFEIILNEHIEATNNSTCDKVLSPSLFGSCLPCIFKFIDLPELAIDFEYNIYNKECQVCKVKGRRALICLDCGKKVCDSRSCLVEFGGEKVPGFIAHCKICGGGRTAYLQSDDCSVLFISNKAVFKKFVPLYVNEFGEGISKRTFGKEYKLNKEEVQKALKMFTEYSYSNAEIIV